MSPVVVRRSFDRLHVATIAPRGWRYVAATDPAEPGWPFVVFYALAGDSIVDGLELAESRLVVVRSSTIAVEVDPGAVLLALRLPHEAIGPYGASMAAIAHEPLPATRGTASLVGHLLRGLAQQPGDYLPDNPGGLAQHIVGLIALMCADVARSSASPHGATLERAKEYIELRLADLDLSPDRIAAELHVSTRTLHRLFEREGLTISGWVRARRLEHCRIELLDASHDGQSVSAIGVRWGLWDAAHFSRLFKAAYGVSPRAYRAEARRRSAERVERAASA